MEIRVIAPGTDCKTTSTSIACKIACDIIEEIFYEKSNDVMTIHTCDGNFVAEVSVSNERVDICRNGKIDNYCLPDAETIIFNMISNYIEGGNENGMFSI
ncbi:MAG: hypothetical protein LBR46_05455 [Prevotella sp.]|jgi:hypothetical protein|nr:hypothetical protein [Prevotella sp.]